MRAVRVKVLSEGGKLPWLIQVMEGSNGDRLDKLENGTNQLFKVVFERLDSIDEKISKKVAGNLEKKDQR